jgi:predicted kinase
MFRVEATSHLPPDTYDDDASGRVYRRLMDRAAAILSAGHSAILDAGFRGTGDREAASKLAAEAGAAFHGLWLEADPERLIARVTRRLNDASDAGPDVVLRQLRAPVPPLPADWSVIDANSGTADTLARARQAMGL